MNQTKKITQGAMMLAIMGALIIIDRMFGFFFDTFIVMIVPLVIIMYSCMNTVKDGMILSVGILILTFLLANFQFIYLIYVPVGIFNGLCYSYAVSKNKDTRTLMLVSIITYTLGEVIATFVVYPLLGFPISTMVESFMEEFKSMSNISGVNYLEVFTSSGFDLVKLIGIIYVVSTIITGIFEGFLIHILSVTFLKRFKIKDLGRINIYEVKGNKPLAYICLFMTSMLFFTKNITNETVYYLVTVLSILSAFVLFYYGYIFVILYGSMVLRKNIGFFVVLLSVFIPSLLMLLIIAGFLYASGPLRIYLERKVAEVQNLQNKQ